MFFKRRPSKSSKSTKPSFDRVSTSNSTHKYRDPKTSSSTVEEEVTYESGEADGDKDYQEFLEKARKDAERKEKELLRSIMKARETNLSPWAGRM